jgi:membrane protein implicated in regulation of membrane protease activity
VRGGKCMNRYMIWLLVAIASIYGAIAAAFLDKIPMSAIAFSLFSIIFVFAAYKELASKDSKS